jgi:hypothetical protein
MTSSRYNEAPLQKLKSEIFDPKSEISNPTGPSTIMR